MNKEFAKDGAAFAATATTGAIAGAYVANKYFPPSVTLSDLAEVQPSIDFGGSGVDVTYGSTLHMPNAIDTITPIVNSGVDINVTTLNASVDNHQSIKEMASLAAQYKPNIVEPIQSAVIERLAVGATIGAVALSAAGYFTYKKYKDIKKNGGFSHIRERFYKSNTKTKALALLCAGVAIFGAGKAVEAGVKGKNEVEKSIVKKPLPKAVTDKNPLLEGAWAEGLGSEIPQKFANAFVEYKKNVKEELDISKKAFEEQFKAYQAKSSSLINNPNYRVAMHISDAHCNYAMYKYGLESVVAVFQPSTIFNSGDTYTNSGTMPYEKNCFNDFRAAIAKGNEKATIINAIGNHDPKNFINIDSDPKVITPTEGDDYTTESEFGKVVVTPDESKATWQSIPEEKTIDMYELVAKQSTKTEEQACKVTEEDGHEPIVIVHRPQVSFGTSMKGCASLLLKGHTHKNQKLKAVLSDSGKKVIHHTAGSMSGTGNTIAIYETPKKPASFSMLYFNDANELSGATTVTFFPGGEVKIEDEKMPKKVDKELNSAIRTPLKEAITLKK
ncbi:hypothetical protein A3F64_02945 [Candidatus Saccharibacteria bacterium RIFCSPHIGHO2_12_FULL_42_8]|nr:MAG: hypothetical protein A3F64_02945 [Candidatus Saccharibacteria bacterium RIFCSPHIGHO2_12_FULL_42_8]